VYIWLVKDKIKTLVREAPRSPGVYIFKNDMGDVIYVGKAKDLAIRLSSYIANPASLLPKVAKMVHEADSLDFFLTESELEALLLEAKLIRQNQPWYNSQAKDDKQPLYIQISSDIFPKITTIRRQDITDKKAACFGPFPSSKTVFIVLKMLRKIFPFCSQAKIGTRPCFYNHLGLCRPCPSQIIKYEGQERIRLTRQYRQNIFKIKKILSGDLRRIIKDLELEMKIASKKEHFEEASEIKNKIERLKYIAQKPTSPDLFLAHPNLPGERAAEGILAFWHRVSPHFFVGEVPRLAEAYDISNISGKLAVGSQVTFLDGQAFKKGYKRYKIRNQQGPNDVGMMGEMLQRRFKHKDWELPGLVLVDGGRQQVMAAQKALRRERLNIPLVGLAKREETIIIYKDNGEFEEMKLKRNDPALHFVQRIRDEAHRFAQSYHHLLMRNRLKKIDES